MSSYRVFGPKTVISAGAMASTDVLTSSVIDISSLQSFSFQAVWTGTAVGTFVVLVSNDGTNYNDLGASIGQNPAGASSSTIILCYGVPAKYAKLQYTNASATGTLNVTAIGKTR